MITAARILLFLVLGLTLVACTRDINDKYFKDPWPPERASNTLAPKADVPTDCTSYTEVSAAQFSTVPEIARQRIQLRFQYHYNSLAPRVIHQEAHQILTRSGSAFRKLGTPNDGIVTKFAQKRIFVFVYSKNLDDIAYAKMAIDRINNLFSDATDVRLLPQFMEAFHHAPPQFWAAEEGIHLYFGSDKCLWRVLDEQVGMSRGDLTNAATINLRDLGGLTVTEALIRNGVPTGRLRRSIAVILNVPSGDHKQSVIEHELTHALGVKGHARSILWTRMSQEGESIAPLARHSGFDRQLLRILYSRLSPGDGAARVADVVKKEWRFSPNRQSKNMPKCVGDIGRRQNNGETIEGVDLVRRLVCEMGITITKNN